MAIDYGVGQNRWVFLILKPVCDPVNMLSLYRRCFDHWGEINRRDLEFQRNLMVVEWVCCCCGCIFGTLQRTLWVCKWLTLIVISLRLCATLMSCEFYIDEFYIKAHSLKGQVLALFWIPFLKMKQEQPWEAAQNISPIGGGRILPEDRSISGKWII